MNLKPSNNIVRFSDTWLTQLIGCEVTTHNGRRWKIESYDSNTEQLLFTPVAPIRSPLGEFYINQKEGSSLSN